MVFKVNLMYVFLTHAESCTTLRVFPVQKRPYRWGGKPPFSRCQGPGGIWVPTHSHSLRAPFLFLTLTFWLIHHWSHFLHDKWTPSILKKMLDFSITSPDSSFSWIMLLYSDQPMEESLKIQHHERWVDANALHWFGSLSVTTVVVLTWNIKDHGSQPTYCQNSSKSKCAPPPGPRNLRERNTYIS